MRSVLFRGEALRWGWALVLLLLPLAGCSRGFQTFSGQVTSDGGGLGRWSGTPQGCSRDPIDGKPAGQSTTLVTFYWEDPANHDASLRDHHAPTAPDVPQELNVLREGDGYAARMKTVKLAGYQFDAKDCTELTVEQSEEPPLYVDGRPTLRGRVRFDCRVHGSRLRADVTFRRCEF